MCIKLVKPLNPEAQEWRPTTPRRPTPPLLPHALIRSYPPLSYSAPPPPQLVVSFSAASHPKMQTHFHHPPLYTISFLPATADRYLLNPAATAAAAPPVNAEITEISEVVINDDSVEPKKQTAKSPKCPRRNASKRSLRLLPPRIQRALRSAPSPPPPKLEWRPKIAAASACSPPMTTLMIKNIPNQLRREFMLNFLDDYCRAYSLEYDFFYLPIDFKKLGNLGYAFVNFTTNAAAMKMKKILSNFSWKGSTAYGDFVFSRKVCEIKWARVQGKKELVRRFVKSNFKCSEREFLPVVLEPPRNGSDPNPPPPVVLGRLCGGPA